MELWCKSPRQFFSCIAFIMVIMFATATQQRVNSTKAPVSGRQGDDVRDLRINCPVSYSSRCNCTAEENSDQVYVSCFVFLSSDYSEIRAAFANSTIENHYQVTFYLLSTVPVPSNVIADKKAERVKFKCYSNAIKLGAVAADAFATASAINALNIDSCDANLFEFGFLKSWISLHTIFIYNSSLYTLRAMPHLPSVFSVTIHSCSGFGQWYPPEQTPYLGSIDIIDNTDIDDERIDYIFLSVGNNYSNYLLTLDLSGNILTRIPPFVLTLPYLSSLRFYNNRINVLPNGSLKITAQDLRSLDLSRIHLETIEPSALVGNFSNTDINLSDNLMTKLPSTIFQPLLQSMVDHNHVGYIYLRGDPIAYDCDLAWLVVDNRPLLDKVHSGSIANGTSFTSLDPADLAAKCHNVSGAELVRRLPQDRS